MRGLLLLFLGFGGGGGPRGLRGVFRGPVNIILVGGGGEGGGRYSFFDYEGCTDWVVGFCGCCVDPGNGDGGVAADVTKRCGLPPFRVEHGQFMDETHL